MVFFFFWGIEKITLKCIWKDTGLRIAKVILTVKNQGRVIAEITLPYFKAHSVAAGIQTMWYQQRATHRIHGRDQGTWKSSPTHRWTDFWQRCRSISMEERWPFDKWCWSSGPSIGKTNQPTKQTLSLDLRPYLYKSWLKKDHGLTCKTVKLLGEKKHRRKSLGSRARQRMFRLDNKSIIHKKENW